MKLAIQRLKSLGLVAIVLMVAISLYPLSLSVASLHSDILRTEKQIVAAKKELRYLETEFAARANMRQLETWNRLDYGYVPPAADQYLAGERALANLERGRGHFNAPVKVALVRPPEATGSIGSPFGDGVPLPSAEAIVEDYDTKLVDADTRAEEFVGRLSQDDDTLAQLLENRKQRRELQALIDSKLMQDPETPEEGAQDGASAIESDGEEAE